MNAGRWLTGVGFACVALSAQADGSLVYSPSVATQAGHSIQGCFLSRSECAATRDSAIATSQKGQKTYPAPAQEARPASHGKDGARRSGWMQIAGAMPEDPLSTLSTQNQFLNTLKAQQARNRRSIQQTDQEILFLENRVAETEAEAARKQRELSGLIVTPAPTSADKIQQNEAQRSAQEALERARIEREQLNTELDRRHHERAQLVQNEKKLLRLESEYEEDPLRAGELMRGLR